MLIFEVSTSKTHWKWGIQALGVSKNDSSWSKAAWSIFQSLFWLENHWPTTWITEAVLPYFLHCMCILMYPMCVFYVCILCMYSMYVFRVWYSMHVFQVCIPCIETVHSMHLNNWSQKSDLFKNCWKPSQKMRLDALIIFLIEWRHSVSISRGKWSKYWS